MKITEIVFLNDVIVKHRQSGATAKMLQVTWVNFLKIGYTKRKNQLSNISSSLHIGQFNLIYGFTKVSSLLIGHISSIDYLWEKNIFGMICVIVYCTMCNVRWIYNIYLRMTGTTCSCSALFTSTPSSPAFPPTRPPRSSPVGSCSGWRGSRAGSGAIFRGKGWISPAGPLSHPTQTFGLNR